MTVCVIINSMDEKKYTMDDLCDKTHLPRRTIRYYVQEGIIDPPSGRGRGGYYSDIQLLKLYQIKSLRGRGMKLHAIEKYLNQGKIEEPEFRRDEWAEYEVMPGLEIRVRRDVEELLQKNILDILKIAQSIAKGDKNHDR
jgi:DNA-binding transcriptional MerR regulator